MGLRLEDTNTERQLGQNIDILVLPKSKLFGPCKRIVAACKDCELAGQLALVEHAYESNIRVLAIAKGWVPITHCCPMV